MYFLFEDECREREALITATQYDKDKSLYKLTLLGLDENTHNYTVPGLAMFEDEDFKELLGQKGLNSPDEVTGRRIKVSANNKECE